MSSARIDFEGQLGGGLFRGSQPVRISKTMPAQLHGYLTPQTWTDFCAKVDEALAPLDKVKRLAQIGSCIFFFGVIVCSLVPILSFQFGSGTFSIIPIVVGPLVMMLGLVSLQCYAGNRAKAVLANVTEVCEDVSKIHPQLSFHIRYESQLLGYSNQGRERTYMTNYIEVSIANAAASAAVDIEASPVVASAIPSTVEKNFTERLAELEAIRHLLTDIEYSEKRQEILSCL